MHHSNSSHPPFRDRTTEGVPSPSRPESEVTLVRLGQVISEDEKKNQDGPSPRSSKTYSELEAASKHDSSKLRRNSGASYLQPIDEYDAEIDIAPVDQPPEIQALQDREPFAILARHLSGVSTGTAGDSKPAPQAFDPPPDGGATAWLVVMGAWFVLFVQFGISKCDHIHLLPQKLNPYLSQPVTSFGQFEEYYASHQLAHLPKQQISWCGSLSAFCVFFFSLLSGRYFDSHGPRLLIIGGTSTGVVALFCLACKQMPSLMSKFNSPLLRRSLQRILSIHLGASSLRYRRRDCVQPVYILRRSLVSTETRHRGRTHPLRIRTRRCTAADYAVPSATPTWVSR